MKYFTNVQNFKNYVTRLPSTTLRMLYSQVLERGSIMTKNQIEYAKLLETRRSNERQEQLTAARDANAHYIQLGNLEETQRANRAKEAQSAASLDEQKRHNQQVEYISLSQLNEQIRSNQAQENISQMSLAERVRAAKAQEAIGWGNVSAQNYRTESSTNLGYANLSETQQANRNREALTETQMYVTSSDKAADRNQQYQIESGRQAIQQQQADETARNNQSRENLTRWSIATSFATGIASVGAKIIPLLQQSGVAGADSAGTIPFVGNAEYIPLG